MKKILFLSFLVFLCGCDEDILKPNKWEKVQQEESLAVSESNRPDASEEPYSQIDTLGPNDGFENSYFINHMPEKEKESEHHWEQFAIYKSLDPSVINKWHEIYWFYDFEITTSEKQTVLIEDYVSGRCGVDIHVWTNNKGIIFNLNNEEQRIKDHNELFTAANFRKYAIYYCASSKSMKYVEYRVKDNTHITSIRIRYDGIFTYGEWKNIEL